MIIQREVNGVPISIKLTSEEISKAHEEHVTNFMRDTLQSDFDLSASDAEAYSIIAYEKYCEGNGETEYECIEYAYEQYCESEKNVEK